MVPRMKHVLAAVLALVALPAAAQAPGPVQKPLAALEATLSGQPLTGTAGPIRVGVTETTVPVGGAIPPHKHMHPRLVGVLAGRLKITNLDTGAVTEAKPGDWMVDPIDQWHEAQNVGQEPVRLLVIDETTPGATLMVPRPR